MKNPRSVIIEPVVSEKAYDGIDMLNAYTFIVHPRANKTEIRLAVEEIFEVKVRKVNTINRKGKKRRYGYKVGKRPDSKRAIVTLADGDSID
ncbi:MAG: 50S ribosomal protein L23, partial [Acidimicrobiia bacterium]|nr:50S ribosomal protein L23 [Acidimicrobiia bacterium]